MGDRVPVSLPSRHLLQGPGETRGYVRAHGGPGWAGRGGLGPMGGKSPGGFRAVTPWDGSTGVCGELCPSAGAVVTPGLGLGPTGRKGGPCSAGGDLAWSEWG